MLNCYALYSIHYISSVSYWNLKLLVSQFYITLFMRYTDRTTYLYNFLIGILCDEIKLL